MPSVQYAMSQFGARGYIRASTLDTAVVNGTATTALIGYLLPGYGSEQAEAYILVVTRRIDQVVNALFCFNGPPCNWTPLSFPVTVYATQVGGGVLVHTATDSIYFVNSPTDPPLAVVSTITSSSAAFTAGSNIMLPVDSLKTVTPAGGSSLLDWQTSYDVYGFNAPAADNTWTFQDCQCPDYWRAIEVMNHNDSVYLIGFIDGSLITAGVLMTGGVGALTIQQVVAASAGAGATVDLGLWLPSQLWSP